MPIRSGIGFGEAQVYSQPTEIVNTYGKLLQRQAQETAKFQEEMADLISKVKTEGARDIDKALIAKGYDELKNLYRQATSVRNTSERNLLRSQLATGIQSLNEAAARSAEEAKLYKDTLGRVATTGQFLYDTKKLNDFKERINKPITELTAFNPLDLERIPDDSVRDKAYDNLYTELRPKSVYQTRRVSGGKEQEVGVVDPTIVTKSIIERIGKSPEWLNLATRNYIQANPDKEPTIEDVVQNEVNLYMSRRGNEYAGAPTRISTGGGAGESKKIQAVSERNALLDAIMQGVPGAEKALLDTSSLPYGSNAQYVQGRYTSTKLGAGKGKPFKMIRVTVPRTEWQDAVSNNPSIKKYDLVGDDKSSKTKSFDFNIEDPDARRGLNVFLNSFSGGANIDYKDVKQQPTGYSSVQQGKDASGNIVTIGLKNNKWYNIKTGKEYK